MAKKNKKVFKKGPKQTPQQFPRISRIFTESLYEQRNNISLLIGVLFLLLAIIITGLDLYKNSEHKKMLDAEKGKIVKERDFWQETIKTHPDFRDAYYNLAVLEYRLKNPDKSREYLYKALELDPNFEKGREFLKVLGG